MRASLPYDEEALATVGGGLDPRLEAQTHGNVGRAHGMLGEPEVLLQAQRRCCDLFRRFGARRDEALSLMAIGDALLQVGPLEESRQTLERALELAEQHGFKAEVGGVLDLLSVVYERGGDLERALAALKRCRAIEGELRDDEARSAVRRLAESDELRRARLEVEDQRRRAAESDRRALEDALTGVANRRALENWLQANRALERDCAVAILDVDRFKSINDLHSHAIGDRVLQGLAAVLGQHHRAADLLARYGGEEFVFVLPGVSLADAVGSCERLRRAIEAHDWSAIAPGLAVTASIGVAVAPAGGSAAAALEAADRRLRLAKRSGRNRTVSAS